MTTETIAKRDIQKLQRAIVDGLEDVKAQDIQVFNTEHLTALFERVIVASGTSNRQTKALAASVRDAVKDDGFPKPRVEGEDNGEWIIVDCGLAVVHIMQPGIRQYYHLEELWGGKPVRLKFGAAKPPQKAAEKSMVKSTGSGSGVAKPVAQPASLKRSNAAKKGVQEAFPSRAQVKKDALAQSAAQRKGTPGTKKTASGAARVPGKLVVVNAPAKPIGKTTAKAAPKSAAKPATKPTVKSAQKSVASKSAPRAKSPAAKTARPRKGA